MDKSITERLDAIEKQLGMLEESKQKMVYDQTKIYIGIKGGEPYILAGLDYAKYYRFHSYDMDNKSETGYDDPSSTGQDCIDSHIQDGFTIHAFDNTRKAFQFFLDNL